MKKRLKNIISISIILSIFFMTSVAPAYAALQTLDQATAAKNAAAKNALNWGVQASKQAAKCAIGFGAKLAIGALTSLIAGLLSPNVSTVDYSKQSADALDKCISSVAIGLAKDQIVKITQSTMNWINTGLAGNPLYVSDINSLVTKTENEVISGELSVLRDSQYAQMYPYGRDFASAQIQTQRSSSDNLYGLKSDILNSLTVGSDIQSYANNFAQGGWNGWVSLTQNPQNNPLGFNMLATDQLALQKEQAVANVKADVAQGGGYQSKKECVEYGITAAQAASKTAAMTELDNQGGADNGVAALNAANATLIAAKTAYNNLPIAFNAQHPGANPTEEALIAQAKKDMDAAQVAVDIASSQNAKYDEAYAYTHNSAGQECTKYETVTPGSTIKDQVSQVVTSPVTQLELVRTLDDALGAVLDGLMGKLQDAGLKGIDELFNTEKSTVPVMSLNSSGELIMGDSTSDGSRNTGGFDLKDLGNTYTEVADNEGDYTLNTTTGLFKGVGANNGNYVLDKKGVIQTQIDFIALAKQNLELFKKIMPALGQLDYCIPGPNPNWESNSQIIDMGLQTYVDPLHSDWGNRAGKYMLDLKDIYSNIMNKTYGPSSPMMNDSNDNCLNGATNPPSCNLNATYSTTTTVCSNRSADNPPTCDRNDANRTCVNGKNYPGCTTGTGTIEQPSLR
jgi:hypothetical protein